MKVFLEYYALCVFSLIHYSRGREETKRSSQRIRIRCPNSPFYGCNIHQLRDIQGADTILLIYILWKVVMNRRLYMNQSLPVLHDHLWLKCSLYNSHLKEIIRFDISMENAILVHMIDSLENLVHQEFDSTFGEIVSSSFYRFIHIHVHQFKHEGKSACGFIAIVNLIDFRVY